MSGVVTAGLVFATFNGVDSRPSQSAPVPVSVPGLRVGDIVLAITHDRADGASTNDGPAFESSISIADEIQQQAGLDRSSWSFKAVFFRP